MFAEFGSFDFSTPTHAQPARSFAADTRHGPQLATPVLGRSVCTSGTAAVCVEAIVSELVNVVVYRRRSDAAFECFGATGCDRLPSTFTTSDGKYAEARSHTDRRRLLFRPERFSNGHWPTARAGADAGEFGDHRRD